MIYSLNRTVLVKVDYLQVIMSLVMHYTTYVLVM